MAGVMLAHATGVIRPLRTQALTRHHHDRRARQDEGHGGSDQPPHHFREYTARRVRQLAAEPSSLALRVRRGRLQPALRRRGRLQRPFRLVARAKLTMLPSSARYATRTLNSWKRGHARAIGYRTDSD